MSPRYRILCYLIIVKKVFLVALVTTHWTVEADDGALELQFSLDVL